MDFEDSLDKSFKSLIRIPIVELLSISTCMHVYILPSITSHFKEFLLFGMETVPRMLEAVKV